jgi:hypothetical protein
VVQLKHEMTRQADLHAVQCKAWSEQHEVITPYYDSVFNGLTFMGGCVPFAVQEALVQLRAAEGKIAALESDAHRNAASFEEHVRNSTNKLENAEVRFILSGFQGS